MMNVDVVGYKVNEGIHIYMHMKEKVLLEDEDE